MKITKCPPDLIPYYKTVAGLSKQSAIDFHGELIINDDESSYSIWITYKEYEINYPKNARLYKFYRELPQEVGLVYYWPPDDKQNTVPFYTQYSVYDLLFSIDNNA